MVKRSDNHITDLERDAAREADIKRSGEEASAQKQGVVATLLEKIGKAVSLITKTGADEAPVTRGHPTVRRIVDGTTDGILVGEISGQIDGLTEGVLVGEQIHSLAELEEDGVEAGDIAGDEITETFVETMAALESFGESKGLLFSESFTDGLTADEVFVLDRDDAARESFLESVDGAESFTQSKSEAFREAFVETLQAAESFAESMFSPIVETFVETLSAAEVFLEHKASSFKEFFTETLSVREIFSKTAETGETGPPQNVSASPITPSCQFQLTWDDPTEGNPQTYEIYRNVNNAGWSLHDTASGTSNSYFDSDITSGFSYAYRMKAINGAYESIFSNETPNTTINCD